MSAPGSGSAWGSLAAGLGSILVLPVAIYSTRFFDAYELLDAGWAIPAGIVLGIVAIVLARRSRVQRSVSLSSSRASAAARVGRVLGVLGLCISAAGVVALGIYGLLEYVGSRD